VINQLRLNNLTLESETFVIVTTYWKNHIDSFGELRSITHRDFTRTRTPRVVRSLSHGDSPSTTASRSSSSINIFTLAAFS